MEKMAPAYAGRWTGADGVSGAVVAGPSALLFSFIKRWRRVIQYEVFLHFWFAGRKSFAVDRHLKTAM